jgi:protein-tyrosine phosphatase
MPGRYEKLEDFWKQVQLERIGRIVCLAPLTEINHKSPEYAKALAANNAPCTITRFPIEDFGVPDDREAFRGLASELAAQLRTGRRLLVHCAGGIGRTGTLAVCTLMALGQTRADAYEAVAAARSRPETQEQHELLTWFEISLKSP